ncbi:hypothetical protein HYH02_012213 [Chlamydomonas schloesseri]|uniref:Uncharacterized protein n=1 Tax=Chlamydomonas schloesseri TaxID=2026947 RepID=A0A835W3G3_9CHLO|nr:hypothetical protein HYH02_012213 [Chlamydomonas schloesseri]|eukprot:KAG2434546.1 hypothetical protein HYH02_012213 [Chlamydomonas schloesseri]
MSSDGSAVTSLCPGASYTVTLSFPDKRLALLTTSPPVTFISPDPTTSCLGRMDLGGSSEDGEDTSFVGTFTVPCHAAGSTVVFAVTSAGSSSLTAKRWAQNQASLAVDDAASQQCAAVSEVCASPPAGPSKPPPAPGAGKPAPRAVSRRQPPPARRPPPRRG